MINDLMKYSVFIKEKKGSAHFNEPKPTDAVVCVALGSSSSWAVASSQRIPQQHKEQEEEVPNVAP